MALVIKARVGDYLRIGETMISLSGRRGQFLTFAIDAPKEVKIHHIKSKWFKKNNNGLKPQHKGESKC